LVATNQAISALNTLETGNYTKSANTFTITSTGTAFQVTSGTSIFSAPVNITSTLAVDNTTTLKNAVNITASGSPLNVSNTAIIGAIQVARDSTFTSNVAISGYIISNNAIGLPPLIVKSNTAVANLNSDLLDGYHASTANGASTIAARGTDGSVTSYKFISTAAFGTAPLTVSSNTLVTNLNAELLNGFAANTANSASTLAARGTDGSVTGYKFISTAATGVSPLTISSTTLVTNLNADLLDGYNTNTANSASTVVVRQADGLIEGNVLKSTVATGTAPLTVTSTTVVPNLNADLLDGYNTNTANSASTVAVRGTDGSLTGYRFTSTTATGVSPLAVSSTTLVSNLNADLLDGFDSSYFAANTENEVISGSWTFTKEILGVANSATKLANTRWFNFSGDVAGSGSFDGTANTNVTLTVQPNSIALGTDTTGNYVGEVFVSGTGLSVANTSVEGGNFTVTSNASAANGASTIVARDTTGDFTTRRITLSAATGTSPLAVTSTTLVTNLNADLLDGYNVGTSGATIPLLNAINTWSATQSITGNLNVTGDLNITGNTIFSGATVNDSGDYILRSNTGSSSSPDSNFIVKRNASPSTTANNATIKWDNTALSWKINDVATNNFYEVLINKPTQTITGTWTFNNEIKSSYSATNSFTLTTATTATNQILASVTAKSAEFLIQANTANSFHTTKLLAMQDGTNAFITEYGTIMNGTALATYDCDITGGNLRLLTNPVNAVTTYKVSATYIN
jgi:hypothetical protein